MPTALCTAVSTLLPVTALQSLQTVAFDKDALVQQLSNQVCRQLVVSARYGLLLLHVPVCDMFCQMCKLCQTRSLQSAVH